MSADVFTSNLRDLPAFRALLRAVETRFYAGLELPEPTLDLGCGDGHFVSTAFETSLAVGIDVSFESARTAVSRADVYRGMVQAGGWRLPFADRAFGSAISNSVLEHIPDIEIVLREISRVLSPGAPFVFTVPSEYFSAFLSVRSGLSKVGLYSMARTYVRFFDRISRHFHYHSPEEWCVLLQHAGFRVERHLYYFSRYALRAFEWGHYLGLPALVARKLTGRWILARADGNLWLTEKLLRRYFEEALPAHGAYLFITARRFDE